MRWLSFRIFHKAAENQNLRFAIRESQAIESVPFSGVIPIQDSHPALLGALQYRGKVSRAFDLGAAIGLGPGHLPQRVRLLMVRQTRTSIPMAIAVQPELEEVSSADAEKLQIVDLKMLSRIGRAKTAAKAD